MICENADKIINNDHDGVTPRRVAPAAFLSVERARPLRNVRPKKISDKYDPRPPTGNRMMRGSLDFRVKSAGTFSR